MGSLRSLHLKLLAEMEEPGDLAGPEDLEDPEAPEELEESGENLSRLFLEALEEMKEP